MMGASIDYVLAEGPDRLFQVLTELLEKVHADPAFALKEHNILYQLGNQQSLIQVDTTQMPFHFWHYDLLGRPATVVVKNTIARFLAEKCDVKELSEKYYTSN